MDDGTQDGHLTGDEYSKVFEVVAKGGTLQEAKRRLSHRGRVTVTRAYNTAMQLQLLKPDTMDDELAKEIAQKARYEATVHYVQYVFLCWQAWARERGGARSIAEGPRSAEPEDLREGGYTSGWARTVGYGGESSDSTRARVLALIHQQVEPPRILDRVLEKPMTKAQFLTKNFEGPGYGWYLGTQAEPPSLKVEDSEEFIKLRMSTRNAPVWHDLDYLKGLVAKSIDQKRDGLDWLEVEARTRSGLIISRDPGIPWGSLTPEFAWSVYHRGFEELHGLDDQPRTYAGNFPQNQIQKYIAVQSSRLQTPPRLGWQGPPPNIPLCFLIEEGQLAVIGYWPKTAYPSRIKKLHGCLIDEWPEVPRAIEILTTDKKLKEGVAKVREGLYQLT